MTWFVQPASSTTVTYVKPGSLLDPQGMAFLRRFEPIPSYAEQSVREIERAVWRQVLVPLTPNQFAALVSFTYSNGEACLKNSALLRQLNAGRYRTAAAEFRTHPNHASRRIAEQRLFLRSVCAFDLYPSHLIESGGIANAVQPETRPANHSAPAAAPASDWQTLDLSASLDPTPPLD